MTADDVAPTNIADRISSEISEQLEERDVVPDPDEHESKHDQEIVDGLLKPQVHEFGAYLLFADPDDGMSPYFAVASAFDRLLDNQEMLKAAGAEWQLDHGDEARVENCRVTEYSSGKIASRGQDSFDAYRWFNVGLVAVDPVTRKTVNFQFRVAKPNATHVETGEPIQGIPDDLPEGIRVQVESAYVDPDDILEILQTLASEMMDIGPDYFDFAKLHPWSRVYKFAEYMRIRREISENRIVNDGGLLDRIARFSSHRRGKGRYEWDNEAIIGHLNTVAMNPTALENLYGEHAAGKILKCYHMRNPEKIEESVPYHPKLEVQFSPEFSPDHSSVPIYTEHAEEGQPSLDDVRCELGTYLANVVSWAGLPLSPDQNVYVSDEYWSLESYPETVAESIRDNVVDDPTEELREREREFATSRLFETRLSEAEESVLKTFADGGDADVDDIAARSGFSSSTVYRTVRKFDDLLDLDNKRVIARDRVIRSRLRELFTNTDRELTKAADSIRRLAGRAEEISEDSPLMQWARRYGVELSQEGREYVLKIQRGSFTEYEFTKILQDGAQHARAVGVHTFRAFAGASIEAPGYSVPRALVPISGYYKTGIGGRLLAVNEASVSGSLSGTLYDSVSSRDTPD